METCWNSQAGTEGSLVRSWKCRLHAREAESDRHLLRRQPVMTQARRAPLLRDAAIVAGLVAVLYFARAILIPLAFAVILTLILSPFVSRLQKMHVRRFPATLLVMIVCVAIAAGIGYVIFAQLLQVVDDLPNYRDNIASKIEALRTPANGALGRAAESVKEISKDLATPANAPPPLGPPPRAARAASTAKPLPVQVVEPPTNDFAYLKDLVQPVLEPLARLGIVLVLTIFLLVEEAEMRNRIFRLAGLSRLNAMTQAMADGTQRVSHYLMLQVLVNASFGLLCGFGLYLIGLPYAVLWGAVAAILRIVPYVGSVVAALLPLVLSLAVFDGWKSPLLVFILFLTLEVITGNFVEPCLYGSHTGLSSLALLVATVCWTALWGPAGLILATPLTVCVVVVGRHVPHLSFLHILFGDQPVLDPDAHLYQRLLAMDEQEARTVAEQYLREYSLPQLYDNVIIPALSRAEHDRHRGALDPEREEFLFLTLREMIAAFQDQTQQDQTQQDQTQKVEEESPQDLSRIEGAERILCVPAHDEADELGAVMLAQLLEHSGHATIAFPSGTPAVSMLAPLKPGVNDVFCVSAIQPLAFSHARTLCRELRTQFPRARIVLCVWGFRGEQERALRRLKPASPDSLVRSLAEVLEHFGVSSPAGTPETVS